MAVQTEYKETIDAGRPGAVVNTEHTNFISRTVEDDDGIGFGLAVSQGTLDKGCKLSAEADTKILGITVRERSVRPDFPNGFKKYDSARVMTAGVIWVQVEIEVSAGDDVFASDGGLISNAGTNPILNARFETSTSGPGLAQVRL